MSLSLLNVVASRLDESGYLYSHNGFLSSKAGVDSDVIGEIHSSDDGGELMAQSTKGMFKFGCLSPAIFLAKLFCVSSHVVYCASNCRTLWR